MVLMKIRSEMEAILEIGFEKFKLRIFSFLFVSELTVSDLLNPLRKIAVLYNVD